MSKKKRGVSAKNAIIAAAGIALVASAVAEQLRLPDEERTWHGELLGIPYDFRVPTVERLQATYWNKETTRVFVPQAFGMGWTVNFYPLVHPRPQLEA